MPTKRVRSTVEFDSTRLFQLRPTLAAPQAYWAGAGRVHYIVVANTGDEVDYFSLYDVDTGDTPGEENCLTFDHDAPPHSTVFFEFPAEGFGIPQYDSRRLYVETNLGCLTFSGYGVPT